SSTSSGSARTITHSTKYPKTLRPRPTKGIRAPFDLHLDGLELHALQPFLHHLEQLFDLRRSLGELDQLQLGAVPDTTHSHLSRQLAQSPKKRTQKLLGRNRDHGFRLPQGHASDY